jgi:hypothetical protein
MVVDLCHNGIGQSGRHLVGHASSRELSEERISCDASNQCRQESNECEVDDRVDDGGVVGITRCTANRCVIEREVATSASAKPWRKLR